MFTQDEIYLIKQYEIDLAEEDRTAKNIISEMEKTLKYQDNLGNDGKSLILSCINKLAVLPLEKKSI